MKNIFAIVVFVSLAISVYDCGYKGPLYMPKKPVASGNRTASKPASSSPWTINGKNESNTAESTVNKN